jgi:hypothetical protein
MGMKYILFEDAGYVIFEGGTKHSTMVYKYPNDKVISAGFVNINDTAEESALSCYGESQSLDIKSDEKDTEYLARRLSCYSGF